MGMMVDFSRIGGVLLFGLAFAVLCIVGKVAGCGLAAYPLGFNTRGALRIGVGMMPRQEVALIVASVALSAGALGRDIFGGVVVMTFVTTLLAPILLARLFDGRSGLRREAKEPDHATERFSIELPTPQLADLVARRMVEAFRREAFFVHHRVELGMYEMRKETSTVFLEEKDNTIVFYTNPANLHYTRLIVLEEMIALREVFRSAADFGHDGQLKQLLMGED
jgi:hypothetical protein